MKTLMAFCTTRRFADAQALATQTMIVWRLVERAPHPPGDALCRPLRWYGCDLVRSTC